MNILVNCKGFIGDILFASSLAKPLSEQYLGAQIFLNIPLPQPLRLLQQNPYIHEVRVNNRFSEIAIDIKLDIPEVDQACPATIYMQAMCGIPSELQQLEFPVWTVAEYDEFEARRCANIRKHGKRVIGYQVDWAWKAYQCTTDTLANGIGAPHRNMDAVIAELDNNFYMIPFGYDRSHDVRDPKLASSENYTRTASYIKNCDYFIGSEGGLSNLAASVGTKCIITTDFIAQNYGPSTGRVRRCDPPKMGPAVYFPEAGHSHLHPCIRDDEIAPKIKQLIETGTSEVFDFTTL
jgi:hypothetical protein